MRVWHYLPSDSIRWQARGKMPAPQDKAIFPLAEMTDTRDKVNLPLAYSPLPQAEMTFPQAETVFPQAEVILPQAEMAFPPAEMTFPLAEMIFPHGCSISRFVCEKSTLHILIRTLRGLIGMTDNLPFTPRKVDRRRHCEPSKFVGAYGVLADRRNGQSSPSIKNQRQNAPPAVPGGSGRRGRRPEQWSEFAID